MARSQMGQRTAFTCLTPVLSSPFELPMEAATTLKTINFLRTLTRDGLLTGDEVWALGKFFIDNQECAESWPGEVLAPMLESAFDDAALSEEEMTLIAQTIGSIEEEWRLKNQPARSESTAGEPLTVHAALIPVIDAKFEIPSRADDCYVVGLKEHTCTCSDWAQRRDLPARHPGRCCKHIAHAFTKTGKVFEPWFQALLDDCFAHGRGTNPANNWHLIEIKPKPALLGGGAGPWWHVLALEEGSYHSFSFNRERAHWSFGATPERAALIERAIRENLAA